MVFDRKFSRISDYVTDNFLVSLFFFFVLFIHFIEEILPPRHVKKIINIFLFGFRLFLIKFYTYISGKNVLK